MYCTDIFYFSLFLVVKLAIYFFFRTLELCLSEVSKCQYFIGILGERYGYVPESYNVPDTPEYDWVRDYPKGASVTELEMHLGVLMYPIQKQDKCVMMIRNSAFIK